MSENEQAVQTTETVQSAPAAPAVDLRTLSVASSPHIGAEDTTPGIMLDVVIALIPALVAAVWFFGFRALTLVLVTVASTVGFEALYRKCMKLPMTAGDLSAVVTGVLLAMCLPANTPYWVAAIGGAFAIVIVKQLFGGLGKNFLNPALAGRVFLFSSFPAFISVYTEPGKDFWPSVWGASMDAQSAATPMGALHAGRLPEGLSLQQLLVGEQAGCLGEVASLMLIAGGLYLVLRKVISPRIPLFYIGTVAVLTFLFPLGGIARTDWMLYNLLSGGLMLGAIFMATDYVTSPVTPTGRTVYAIGCGVLTVFLRYFGIYPEAVSFSILVMNILVWSLDKAFMPHRFGTPWFKKKAKEASK